MHLPIRVVGRSKPVEVPFQLQPSFCFGVHIPGIGVREFVAELSNKDALTAKVARVESKRADTLTGYTLHDAAVFARAKHDANVILSSVLRRLGLVDVAERLAVHGPDALTWIAIAHDAERRASNACANALTHITPVWRDRTEPAPSVRCAADILDSYYQQVMDEVLGEWEDKAQREHAEYLTGRAAGGNSEVAP